MSQKRLIAMVAAVSIVASLFAGCRKTTTEEAKTPTDTRTKTGIKVGLSTDAGGKGDKSFNDVAIAGLEKIQKEYTVKPVILESKNQNSYSPNLTALSGECDLTIGIGYLMQQAVTDIAKANSNKKFAIIDYNIDLPNVVSINFKTNEGSFLAGILAGKATKSNKVGFIGGEKIPFIEKFEAGFIAGVMTVNPAAAAELLNGSRTIYTGKFDDIGAGKEAAKTLYNSGCDVIYHAAGSCGLGLLDAAEEMRTAGRTDIWAIGSEQDQAQTVPKDADAILSSCMKRADTAAYIVTKSLIEGSFKGGTTMTLGLKEDGVGIAPTKNAKAPAGIYDLSDKYKQAILDGKIVVPETIDQAKTFKPVVVE
jgi:basic membrane protein A and related proteins